MAEIFSESHRALQLFCADYWDRAEDCEDILSQVVVGPNRINMAEPAIARWFSIVKELIRKNDGSMQRLVVVLIKQYPDNDALRTVCQPWIPAVGAKITDLKSPPEKETEKSAETLSVTAEKNSLSKTDLPPGTVLVEEFPSESEPEPEAKPRQESKPKSKRDPVPVVAPADFADEADLVVPRINTLWDVMIEQEERIVQLENWMRSVFASVPKPKTDKKRG